MQNINTMKENKQLVARSGTNKTIKLISRILSVVVMLGSLNDTSIKLYSMKQITDKPNSSKDHRDQIISKHQGKIDFKNNNRGDEEEVLKVLKEQVLSPEKINESDYTGQVIFKGSIVDLERQSRQDDSGFNSEEHLQHISVPLASRKKKIFCSQVLGIIARVLREGPYSKTNEIMPAIEEDMRSEDTKSTHNHDNLVVYQEEDKISNQQNVNDVVSDQEQNRCADAFLFATFIISTLFTSWNKGMLAKSDYTCKKLSGLTGSDFENAQKLCREHGTTSAITWIATIMSIPSTAAMLLRMITHGRIYFSKEGYKKDRGKTIGLIATALALTQEDMQQSFNAFNNKENTSKEIAAIAIMLSQLVFLFGKNFLMLEDIAALMDEKKEDKKDEKGNLPNKRLEKVATYLAFLTIAIRLYQNTLANSYNLFELMNNVKNHKYKEEISGIQQLSAYFFGSTFGMSTLAKDFFITQKGFDDLISIFLNNPYSLEGKCKKICYNIGISASTLALFLLRVPQDMPKTEGYARDNYARGNSQMSPYNLLFGMYLSSIMLVEGLYDLSNYKSCIKMFKKVAQREEELRQKEETKDKKEA